MSTLKAIFVVARIGVPSENGSWRPGVVHLELPVDESSPIEEFQWMIVELKIFHLEQRIRV